MAIANNAQPIRSLVMVRLSFQFPQPRDTCRLPSRKDEWCRRELVCRVVSRVRVRFRSVPVGRPSPNGGGASDRGEEP